MVQSLHFNECKIVFNAFIQSFLAYGIVVWGHEEMQKSLINKLFKVQKRAIRTLYGIKDQTSSCRGLFKKSGLLTLTCLYLYHSSLFARSNFLSQTGSKKHDHNTRNKNKLYISDYCKGEVKFRCISIYNKLPIEVSSKSSKNTFKLALKNYLLEKEFYCLDEFLTS